MVIGSLVTIATVGQQRKPMTGGAAAVATVLNVGVIFLLVWGALHS
jgi:hypothetical protein